MVDTKERSITDDFEQEFNNPINKAIEEVKSRVNFAFEGIATWEESYRGLVEGYTPIVRTNPEYVEIDAKFELDPIEQKHVGTAYEVIKDEYLTAIVWEEYLGRDRDSHDHKSTSEEKLGLFQHLKFRRILKKEFPSVADDDGSIRTLAAPNARIAYNTINQVIEYKFRDYYRLAITEDQIKEPLEPLTKILEFLESREKSTNGN